MESIEYLLLLCNFLKYLKLQGNRLLKIDIIERVEWVAPVIVDPN